MLAVVVATAILARSALTLRVEIDPDRQLPQGHPYIAALNEVHRLFGDKNLVVIGLFPNDGNVFSPSFLTKLAEVTDRVRQVPGANPALIQSLSSPHVKTITGNEDGLVVERVMEKPPTDQAGADAVRVRAMSMKQYVGTLVSPDGTAAAVQASFELTPSTPGYRQLHDAVLTAVAKVDDGTFRYRLSGPVVFLSHLSTYAARMVYYFPLALLVIGLIHYEAFRTLQALFLPLLTALLSVVWAVGLMGLLGVSLDPFNTTTPILILAVAAGHAVQILKRFYEEYDGRRDVKEAITRSLERVGPVMIAAGSIAALSFTSLVTFQTATIRTFGIFTAFGIISALALELTIIPAVRAMLPPPRKLERAREAEAHPFIDAFLSLSQSLSRNHARGVVIGAIALVVVCIALAARIEVDTSHKREFSQADPVRVDDEAINGKFAGTNTLIALVEGPSEGALEEPTIMRAVWELERRLEAQPGVGKALSYVDFLATMHRAMNADVSEAGRLPKTRALTAQYLFLYSLSGSVEDFDTLIDPMHRIAKVRFLVHEDSTAYGQRLISLARDQIARTFPAGYSVRFTGTLASTAAATEVMVHGKLRNIIQIAVITLVIASLLLRSWIAGVLVATPLALSVLVNFGAMGLFRIPLDAVTSAISAMAVGIGADYAIYFLFRLREELGNGGRLDDAIARTLMTSGKAVLFVSTAIALGYATLCFSRFGFHIQLGSLVALAMLVSSSSALVLLPAIVTVSRPAFLMAAHGVSVTAGPVVASVGGAPVKYSEAEHYQSV